MTVSNCSASAPKARSSGAPWTRSIVAVANSPRVSANAPPHRRPERAAINGTTTPAVTSHAASARPAAGSNTHDNATDPAATTSATTGGVSPRR